MKNQGACRRSEERSANNFEFSFPGCSVDQGLLDPGKEDEEMKETDDEDLQIPQSNFKMKSEDQSMMFDAQPRDKIIDGLDRTDRDGSGRWC